MTNFQRTTLKMAKDDVTIMQCNNLSLFRLTDVKREKEMVASMFETVWSESCGMCYEEKEIYFKNLCRYKEAVYSDCFQKISKCPFCRSEITKTVPTQAINNNGFLSELDMSLDFASSGIYESSDLSRQEADRARENWGICFELLNGRNLLRPYFSRHLFNNDSIHFIFNTGPLDDLNDAGICLGKREAYQFVQNQIMT